MYVLRERLRVLEDTAGPCCDVVTAGHYGTTGAYQSCGGIYLISLHTGRVACAAVAQWRTYANPLSLPLASQSIHPMRLASPP